LQELAAVIRDPDCALFQQVPEDSGLYQPSEKAHVQSDALDVVSMFRSLGIVVAKAIGARACFPLRFTQYASRQPLPAHAPVQVRHALMIMHNICRSFLKQMLDEKLDLDDLQSVDEQHHQGLMNILNNPLASLGMDGLTFTTESSFFGRISTIDLIPKGSQVMVRSYCAAGHAFA
jgi:hypothetical protein